MYVCGVGGFLFVDEKKRNIAIRLKIVEKKI